MRYVVYARSGKLLRRRPQFRLYTGAHTHTYKYTYMLVCVQDMCVFLMAFSLGRSCSVYFYKICSCKNSLIMKYFHRTKFQCTTKWNEIETSQKGNEIKEKKTKFRICVQQYVENVYFLVGGKKATRRIARALQNIETILWK